MKKIAVLGGGSWATALIKILSSNVETINWWLRSEETADFIKKYQRNPNYLTDVEINTSIVHPSSDLLKVVKASDILILAIPAAFLKDAMSPLNQQLVQGKLIFSAVKGIIPQHNQIVGEFIHDQFSMDYTQIGVITGPCHAEEVALEKLSYLTVASSNISIANELAELLKCRYIKTIVSDDIFGTEYSAVLKNVMAIANGICHGLGYGDNFQAVLISSAIREIKRFVDAVQPLSRDINDSAYLGDLLVTAYSQFSRNRTFGSMLGKGYSVKSAQLEMNMIAEGFYAVACIYEMNSILKVDLPICTAVYNICYEKKSPKSEMSFLSEQLH